MRLLRSLLVFLLLSLICVGFSGCAVLSGHTPTPDEVASKATQADADKVHTELVQDMIKQHRYYAALAHIQQLQLDEGKTSQLMYLKAETLRKLGQTVKAGKYYRQLLKTSYAAQAQHGLGLIEVHNNMAAALKHLRKAVALKPTDGQMRNDLGYALMLDNRFDQARTQFETAVQLDNSNSRSRNNLIVLLLIEGHHKDAHVLASKDNVAAQTWNRLQKRAADWPPKD